MNYTILLQPQPSGNCMNWVLGHLLDSRIELTELLDVESPVDPVRLALYKRESAPIAADVPGVLPLEQLLEYHDRAHETLAARLAEMSDAERIADILARWKKFDHF